MAKYWEITQRYYKSQMVYVQEEADIRAGIKRFNSDVDRTTQHIAKTSEFIRSMIQTEKPVIPVVMNGFPAMLPQSQMNTALTTASKYQDLIQTKRRLQEAKDELDERWDEVGDWISEL